MGYSILALQPEIEPTEPERPDKLQPLSPANIPLRPELGNPGQANKDLLAELIVKARNASDETKKSWTAADFNNLACAHFWFNGAREKAITYFEEALKKPSLGEEEKKIIASNLNLLKRPSTKDGKE